MATEVSTPPLSRSSSNSSTTKRHSPGLSLDLSDLPALSQPSPPSNTLIITNLQDPRIFTPTNLTAIRTAISAQAPLCTFSPLRSFRRIIAVFADSQSATTIRSLLDGETVLGSRVRVYFGEDTDLEKLAQSSRLAAPAAERLFFISPPPSPPHGWTMRNEDPPNKSVHAADLAEALGKLGTLSSREAEEVQARQDQKWKSGPREDLNLGEEDAARSTAASAAPKRRSRSSTIVFDPVDQGHSPDLPAIAVEDTGDMDADELATSPGETAAEIEGVSQTGNKNAFVHTARPPVELMG